MVAIGGPKPRLLLAFLAAHRGSVVSSERLCDELGDDQPADPTAVLQSHLSLCAVLRPEVEILARPPGYVLEVADERIDAGRFEQLCARQRGHGPAVRGRRSKPRSCWRGQAFEELRISSGHAGSRCGSASNASRRTKT
jgi:DNA-binding SARP family transcriptional activator